MYIYLSVWIDQKGLNEDHFKVHSKGYLNSHNYNDENDTNTDYNHGFEKCKM